MILSLLYYTLVKIGCVPTKYYT